MLFFLLVLICARAHSNIIYRSTCQVSNHINSISSYLDPDVAFLALAITTTCSRLIACGPSKYSIAPEIIFVTAVLMMTLRIRS